MTDSTTELEELVPPADELDRAATAVERLFNEAGIERVVFVDDDFAADLDEVLSACAQLGIDAAETSVFSAIDFTVPREIWEPAVQARWDELDDPTRAVAGADVVARAFPEGEGGQLNAGALQPLIPTGVDFLPVSGRTWLDETRASVLGSAAEVRTLVLFDRVFEKEDLGRDGLAMLIDLYAEDAAGTVWCGLLTHTVTKDNEDEERRALTAEPGIRAERFVLVSKLHLGPEPDSFPQAMKVALLSSPSSELAGLVANAITTAVTGATAKLAELAPVDFERLVFHMSAEEGLWEPDTLLRLFNIQMRSDLHAALHAQQRIAELTDTLRAIASIETQPGLSGAQAALRARQLHRLETYETPEHLGALHLPVQLAPIVHGVR